MKKPATLPAHRTGPPISVDPLWLIACHEAAHAVVAASLGILGDESLITIVRDGHEEGSVEFSKDSAKDAWKKWPVSYTRRAIISWYAGPAASLKLEPDLDLFKEGDWFELDFYAADEFRRWICDPGYPMDQPDKQMIFETQAWKKAVALVEQNWPTITSVADALMEQKTMHGHAVKARLK